MNNKLYKFLLKRYRKLPEGMKCWASKIIFKPAFGKNVDIYGKVQFEDNVMIGDYSYIHGPAYLGSIHIGKFCSIAKNLSCITSNHDMSLFSTYPFYAQIEDHSNFDDTACLDLFKPILPDPDRKVTCVGNDVWIGESVTIMHGVKIGDGAVIGAHSLVLKDIPPYAIAVGIPAKVIKYRLSEEKISFLQEIEWWNWPISKIKNNFHALCHFDKESLRKK